MEAQIMEISGADIIEESTQLTVNDDNELFIDKRGLSVPSICWTKNLIEVVNAIHTGATAVIIGKDSDVNDSDNAVDIVGNLESIREEREEVRSNRAKRAALNPADPSNAGKIKELDDEIDKKVKKFPELKDELIKVCAMKEFPILFFAHGVKATPADVALLVHHGYDAIILGSSDVFSRNANPLKYASSLHKAIANYNKPAVLMDISDDMGRAAY
ncbi:hypothetical protein LPJ56_005813 [Coemansia sp. RSA 2599]|nr:hypothetical protein LPJ56_005813 [Coemansia sp. RSA 2599]